MARKSGSCSFFRADFYQLAHPARSPVTKRLTGGKMAKQRISSVDLSWLISEEFDSGSRYRKSLAVVPDKKDGWRIIVGKRHRGLLTAAE
jgi:hypothetical protein